MIYFITTEKCKQLAGINGNTDDFLVRTMISENQRIYIEPILGTALYDEISEQIENNNVSVLNARLLDEYILPCLALYVKSDAAINLNYKLTNKAVTTKNSDNSTPVDNSDAIFLSNRWKNRAEIYAERTTRYLRENRTSYPLWQLPGTGFDDIQPNINNFTCGIVLDPCEECGYQNCRCLNQPAP